jgi:hypothetical protein
MPEIAEIVAEQVQVADAETLARDVARVGKRFAVKHKLAPYDAKPKVIADPAYRHARRLAIRANTFPINKVLEIINPNRAAMQLLLNAIKTHSGLKFGPVSLPVSFHKRGDAPDEITVYPNLLLDLKGIKALDKHLSPMALRGMNPVVFGTIQTLYQEEKSDARKAAKWAAPERYFGKVEKLNMVRYIRKYFPKQIEGLRDDQLRDIADKVANQFKPPAIIYADTPEQYFEMFTCATGSCCTVHGSASSSYTGQVLREVIKEGRFSSEWYHWNPHVRGVYIKKEGVVVARAWLLRDDITKEFEHYYTGILGTGMVGIDALRKMLDESGYTVYRTAAGGNNWGSQLNITATFYVPPIEHKGELYMPLPFHDPVTCSYYITWDPEKNMFRCGPAASAPRTKHVKNKSPYDFQGMVPRNSVWDNPERSVVKKGAKKIQDAVAA